MAKVIICFLFSLAIIRAIFAGPALTTPAPKIRRDDQRFIGWTSAGVFGSSTSWETENCLTGYTLTSARAWWKCCPSVGACNIFTSCSADSYLVGPSTSVDCSSYCSSDILFQTLSDISAQAYFWCASESDFGANIYRTSPPAFATTSSSPSSTTSFPTPGSTSPTTVPVSPSSKSNAGAIAGGVVGGIAVIGLIVAGVLYMRMRSKKKEAQPMANHTTPTFNAPPGNTDNYQSPGAPSTYPPPEKSGTATATQAPYSPPDPQSSPSSQPYYVPQQGSSPQSQGYPQGYFSPADTGGSPSVNMNSPASYAAELHATTRPANAAELESPTRSPPPQYHHPDGPY
jgi:hypothetical protein